ncbi:hypothetical protein F4825DRAFT_473282 [Nemania diffusa]|nr:hypothetical protein F4825DRAFT_473282 [Nemania diffusa]
MVGIIERFRKPKSPIVLGSPQTDGVVHQQATPRTQIVTPPVLRNFSYPTNITNNSPPPSISASPSTWDQLGEICNFSPDIDSRIRRDRTAGLEDPFFYTTDRTPYKQLVDVEKITTSHEARHSTDSVPLSIEPKNVEKREPKDKGIKRSTNSSIGDHIFSQKSNITARLKRSSLGHHKPSSSFDASRLLARGPRSLERPMSSSGVPLIDTRLTSSTRTTVKNSISPSLFLGDTVEDTLVDLEKSIPTSYAQLDSYVVDMAPFNSTGSPQGLHHEAGLSRDRQRDSRDSESYKRKGKGKDSKTRWLSQLKEWVSVSEPSTQALRSYKKDTYKKAGIALDDPLANAKLHLPVASLPPDVIKPAGRGPEPEEIALQKAAQRKKARKLLPVTGASQGSSSSTSHYSSSSSTTVGALKDGE